MTAIILVARLLSSCAAVWPLRPWRAHRGPRSIDAGSQTPLGGKNARDARVQARRLGEGATHGLEGGFGDVMQVLAVVHVDVQGDLGMESEGPEEVLEEIEVEVRDSRAAERHVENEKGPARDVHRGVQQRLVHG